MHRPSKPARWVRLPSPAFFVTTFDGETSNLRLSVTQENMRGGYQVVDIRKTGYQESRIQGKRISGL
jgi:hypothetical protein